MRRPNSIRELATPADYNPRFILAEAKAGLTRSLTTFGDLSGIVWNARTGHLVAGHQRMDSLIEAHGEAALQIDHAREKIVAPDGSEYSFRVVDWDIHTEKAANLTANNPFICGEFSRDAADILREIQQTEPDDCEALLLNRIGEIVSLTGGDSGRDAPPGDRADPNQSLSPANVNAVIGAYRFEIERDAYDAWLEDIRQEHGFDEKSVIEAIRGRLDL